jgi:hypothetical protein
MKTTILSVVLLIGIAVSGIGQTKSTLDNLSWLSGCWEGRDGDSLLEEHWSKPEGQAMLGFGRTIKNNKMVFYEFLQIREEMGGLVYLPQVKGAPPVPFRMTAYDNDKFVFENPSHDFPQRIIYQRQNLMLLAAIEGLQKGKPVREEYLMKRVRCNDLAN